jgi:two-component system chemotaxis response regulator CheB
MVKPTGGYDSQIAHDICERVYHAACTRSTTLMSRVSRSPSEPAVQVKKPEYGPQGEPCRRGAIILIGASTGGVAALEMVLPALDPEGPPVMVVQHMPGNFLVSFSERLDRHLPQTVRLAEEGLQLRRGDVVLAPGRGEHTQVRRSNGAWTCHFVPNDPPALHCPAVDVLFKSAVSEARNVSAALLTGLGRDGADGLLELSQAGARTFGQDEATCVVYGMPRAARAIGAVQKELPLDQLGRALRKSRERSAMSASGAARTSAP